MKAIILAGGEGSRLRPLTCDIPKPMAELCGRPVSEYILDLLNRHGITEAIFTLRYLGNEIERYFSDGKYKDIKLSFSYENEPLGTAGCVKKAAEALQCDDDILVISGDAMCDFNLSSALLYHKKMNAQATIISSVVNDPREYGLVIEENGIITGFSEKPSYSACTSELANTGIYILSKSVMDLIPNDSFCDFAKDIFPQMLSRKMKLCSYNEKGYWCDIGDIESYRKCQYDMLEKKVVCDFSSDASHKGQEPVYFGKNVTVGNGTEIFSHSVICDNVTIGKNCKIRGSIILDGAFIGNNVTLNYAVVCKNAVIENSCSVFENAVIGADTVIEEGCFIKSGSKVWNGKRIQKNTTVSGNVKFMSLGTSMISDDGCQGQTNAEITPSFMAVMGAACGAIFNNKILCASSDENSASVLCAAFCTGASSSGADIVCCGKAPLSVTVFLSRQLDAEGIAYISGSETTKITLLNKGGVPLSRVQERKLEAALSRHEYKSAEWNGFGAIKYFCEHKALYEALLNRRYNFASRYKILIKCNNRQLKKAAQAIAKKVSNDKGEKITVLISADGTKAEIEKDGAKIADRTLMVLSDCAELMKKGADAAVPIEYPSSFEFVAQSLGKSVYRYFSCSNDNSDLYGRQLAATEDFLFDGVILAFDFLEAVARSLVSVEEFIKTLPELSCENRFVPISVPPQKILHEIAQKSTSSEGVYVGERGNRVFLRSNRRGNGLFLFAEAASAETAASLCDDVEKRINELIEKKKQS